MVETNKARSLALQEQPLRGEVLERTVAPKPLVALLDLVSLIMDRLVQVPGTRVRFGLNSFFLLLPILGDVIPTAVSFGILFFGLTHYRVPRIVAARMVCNSVLDAAIGWIPLVGDLFDVWFKADTRNVRLLQEYAAREEASAPPATKAHWAFVIGLLALLVILLGGISLGAILLVQWLFRLRGV